MAHFSDQKIVSPEEERATGATPERTRAAGAVRVRWSVRCGSLPFLTLPGKRDTHFFGAAGCAPHAVLAHLFPDGHGLT